MTKLHMLNKKVSDDGYFFIYHNSSDISDNETVWTPDHGKRFVIHDLIVNTDTALNFTFTDGDTTIAKLYLAANGGAAINLKMPYTSQRVGNLLKCDASASGNVTILITGEEID